MLIVLEQRKLIGFDQLEKHLDDLDKVRRQITNFRKSIK